MLRRTTTNTVNANGAFDIAANYYFQMSQVPGSTELSTMFQKVKLLSVDCEWVPRSNVATASATTLTNNKMYVAFNGNNDQTGLPSSGSIRESNKYRVFNFTDNFKMRIYPVAKRQLGSAGITSYYEQRQSKHVKIDSNSLGLEYYGLDWVIIACGLANTVTLGNWLLTYNIVGYLPK